MTDDWPALRKALLAEVKHQLPGLPEPRIYVVLSAFNTIEQDAQRFANELGEPVAIVDMTGRLRAYRMPE